MVNGHLTSTSQKYKVPKHSNATENDTRNILSSKIEDAWCRNTPFFVLSILCVGLVLNLSLPAGYFPLIFHMSTELLGLL